MTLHVTPTNCGATWEVRVATRVLGSGRSDSCEMAESDARAWMDQYREQVLFQLIHG